MLHSMVCAVHLVDWPGLGNVPGKGWCDKEQGPEGQAKDQDPNRAAVSRHRSHVVLGAARLWTDQHAQGRWMADARRKTWQSAD